jgi:citrate lyase subunit beta/citryl-CoA lyase
MDEAEIATAAASGADALILDLEDLVLGDERPRARKLVRRKLEELGARGHTLFVRVNGIESGETRADLEAIACDGLYAIALPKLRGAADVTAAAGLLDAAERSNGVAVGRTIIYPLLESAQAIREAYDVGRASSRVAHMGGAVARGGDLTRSLGFEWTPLGLETLYLREKVLIDARAAGVAYSLSGMTLDRDGLDALRTMGEQTRQIGYTGMLICYPNHAPVVNEIFSPSPEEIRYWQELMEVMAGAEREGKAQVTFRGGFVDPAMVKTGQIRLDLARRYGLLA